MILTDQTKIVVAAPAFPAQVFPNGYPGYPIRGDSSQPSLGDDRGHALMSLEDQVRHFNSLQFWISLLYFIISARLPLLADSHLCKYCRYGGGPLYASLCALPTGGTAQHFS